MKAGNKLSLQFLTSLVCLMAIFMAACGGPGSTGPTGVKQTVRFPVVGDPDIKTVDPGLVEDTDSNTPIQAIFTGLVTLDKDLKVVPALASALPTVTDGGQTYTFKLKPNLKFSNGDPLTSKDVAYSINRAVSKDLKSTVSGYLNLLKDYSKANTGKITTLIGDSILTPDDSTVVLKISSPAAYFLETLAYPTSYVVNQKIVDKYKATWTDHLSEGAGSGPFKVDSYSHSTGLELSRNDNYAGLRSKLDHLSIVFYKDQDAMYKAYQAKQLDFTYVPTSSVSDEKSNPDFKATNVLTIRYLSMNYLSKPFDNQKVRQAFAMAIDKESVVKTALNGAFTATNHIIPQGMPGYFDALTGPNGTTTKGDAVAAKQLLIEGLKEESLTIDTMPAINLTYYPREQSYKDAMSQVTNMWQEGLGVKVNVTTVSRPSLLTLETATTGNPKGLMLWQAGWNADYPDPQDWLSTFFNKGSDYNQFNYGQNSASDVNDQQAVQKELQKADTTGDQVARMKLYNDAEQKIINDAGWIPLWQEGIHTLTSKKIHNLELNAQQLIPPDDWSTISVS